VPVPLATCRPPATAHSSIWCAVQHQQHRGSHQVVLLAPLHTLHLRLAWTPPGLLLLLRRAWWHTATCWVPAKTSAMCKEIL
jgi:hypothetical protein